MECEMESVETTNNKDLTDRSIDVEWQIDSEWINLSSELSSIVPVNNKKVKKASEATGMETDTPPTFHFLRTPNNGRFLVIDHKHLRLSQKKPMGYSYWVCSIPCCTARCVLDPEEKRIVRFCRDHNHELEVSRQEYKKFINALKIAVKENPNVKPKILYDIELEKARERWKESNLKNNSNEEEPSLPSFEAVRTAMYNSRNAMLSAVSAKSTPEKDSPKRAGTNRSTRSRDSKAIPKQNSPSKVTTLQSCSDLDELEEEENKSDEDWNDSPRSKSSSSRQNCEDVNFHFLPSSRGCQILVIDGCLLHQNTVRTSGKSYWRCQKKGCIFRAVYDPKTDKVAKTTGLHNHPPDSNQMMRRQFINNVKYGVTDHPHIPARQIYEKEVHKVQQEFDELGVIWKIPPFSCVKHHAYRARKIATRSDDDDDRDEYISLEQPIKRQITESEKKFLEESVPLAQKEEAGLNISLLSPGPSLIQSKNFPDLSFYFIPSKKGKRILVVNDFTFRLNSQKSGSRYYWKCTVDPCLFRCVYNENLKDLIKISGKHTHASNANRLRIREFCFLLKARMADDVNLTPKKAYDQEMDKIRSLENGETLIKCLPAYCSIRTSLYNQKHKRAMEDEQSLLSGDTNGGSVNSYYMGSSGGGAFTGTSSHSGTTSLDQTQDISPKDITHLSLEDNDPMEHEDDDRISNSSSSSSSSISSSSSNSMEIAAPSLYDSHDIIDQYCSLSDKGKSTSHDESSSENQVIIMPDPAIYSLSFVPTTRGGRALVVNGCVLRISYTREYITYWRCPNNECSFRCSYNSKEKKLLRISGQHNHPVNRYSPVIRAFVRKIKKRVCQENDLSPKIIYDEELEHFKGEVEDTELLKRLPGYDSLKSTLYKVKNKSVRASTSQEDTGDYSSHSSDEEKDEESSVPDVSPVEDPPDDPLIEEGFSAFNLQLPAWLEQDPGKRILDGHLLVKRSSSENSSGWGCTKDDCPFRCVVDNDSGAVTRGQWEHTHKSLIKQTISQAMFNAVRRRALMDLNIAPKLIYEQERKRILDKICGNKLLLKFIPSLTQVYLLVTKTRANPHPPPLKAKVKNKPSQKKRSSSSNTERIINSNCTGVEQFDTDYLLDRCEGENERVTTYSAVQQQQQQNSVIYEQASSNVLSAPPLLDAGYNHIHYQQHFPHNPAPTQTIQNSTFNSTDGQTMFSEVISMTSRSSQYIPTQPYLHQQPDQAIHPPPSHQHQHPSSCAISSTVPPHHSMPVMQQPSQVLDAQLMMAQMPQTVGAHNSENVFSLHGYPLVPVMTSMNTIYWQCLVPSCRYQCVFNVSTSQLVEVSDSHNHKPPSSHSVLSTQVVKMLQKRSIENMNVPLSSVYWEYMKNLRSVINSEEIFNSLPRFQDVAMAMQSSRSAMGTDGSTYENHSLITGSATQSNKVYEYHFHTQTGALVVNGDVLVNSWRMNEISYWRCKTVDCRFKCMLDEELHCVHVLNLHVSSCPSSSLTEDKSIGVKRKHPDKQPSQHKAKFLRVDDMKHKMEQLH